jgi:hypothetical protein
LTEEESSVIVAEVTYSYKPVLGLNKVFSPGAFEMSGPSMRGRERA